MWRAAARLLAATLALAACSDDASNFSQHQGFAEWYAAHPPSAALPTAAEQALLERYRPRVFLPADHPGPLDFYRDYIGQGELRAADGALIAAAVTPEVLNAHKHDPGVVFTHRPSGAPPRPVIYGRIDRGDLALPDCAAPLPVTFLTWHLVFARSGLPAGLPRLAGGAARPARRSRRLAPARPLHRADPGPGAGPGRRAGAVRDHLPAPQLPAQLPSGGRGGSGPAAVAAGWPASRST